MSCLASQFCLRNVVCLPSIRVSDMDAELAALDLRRAKTHALKQGMMLELLTGKTRLL